MKIRKKIKDKTVSIFSILFSIAFGVLLFIFPLTETNSFFFFSLIAFINALLLFLIFFIGTNHKKFKRVISFIEIVYSIIAVLILIPYAFVDTPIEANYLYLSIVAGSYLGARFLIYLFWKARNRDANNSYKYISTFEFVSLLHSLYFFFSVFIQNFSSDVINIARAFEFLLIFIIFILSFLSTISVFLEIQVGKNATNKEKIKYVLEEFKKHHVFFYMGILASYILAYMSFSNYLNAEDASKDSHLSLAIFYFAMSTIRLVAFYVHMYHKKKIGCNKQRMFKREHVFLLVTSLLYWLLGGTFSVALAFIIREKSESTTSFWWFIIVLLPMGLFKLYSAIDKRIKARKYNDPYLLSMSDNALICSLYSFLGSVALMHVFIDPEQLQPIMDTLVIVVSGMQTLIIIVSFIRAIGGLIGKRKIDGYNPVLDY